MARISCLLLAICLLFCGCGAKSDPPPPSENTTGASAGTADGTEATAQTKSEKEKGNTPSATWREAYAEAAINSLADSGLKACTISLFHNYDEPPLLLVTYTYTAEDDEGWKRFRRVWKYENSEALVVYEGEDYIEGVRIGTGNPVVFSQSLEGDTYHDYYIEHGLSQTTPLLEFIYDNSDQSAVYHSLLDDSSWDDKDDPQGQRLEELFVQQVETLPLVDTFEPSKSAYADFDPTEKIRDFLGVSDWSAAVPADAPPWISDYISLLHNHLFFSYDPDKSVNIVEEGLSAEGWDYRFPGVKLLAPPEPGAAPILCGNFVALSDFGDDIKVIPLKNRMLMISNGPDDGYNFYMDTNGNHLIESWAYTSSIWQVIGEYDLKPLLHSGIIYLEELQYAYLDDEQVEFEDSELAMAWVAEKLDDQFDKFGYGELFDWPQIEIHLPEVASWNEIEPILIEKLCHYAKVIGQM